MLGPLVEPALRQSLLISRESLSIFFTRTYAGPITVIAIILLVRCIRVARYAKA